MRVPFKFTMAGAAFAALALGYGVWAQPVGQNTFSGNECWNAGVGPGGPSVGFLCSQAFRGGTNNLTATVAGNTTLGLSNSANITPANTTTLQYGGRLLLTAQPSAAVITMPQNPLQDGIVVSICNTTAAAFATNAVTIGANNTVPPNQTVPGAPNNTLTTLGAGTCGSYQWSLANATWYRVQ
jgi:hypothetical protein